MLSVAGDADAAVEARIQIGWTKFRRLVPLLTIGYITDKEREAVQQLCAKYAIRKRDLAGQERKRGGISARRDENGQMDV